MLEKIFFSLLIFLNTFKSDPLLDNNSPLSATQPLSQQKWVDSLYSNMTLEEKIGQLFMIQAFSSKDEKHYQLIENQIKDFNIGGVILSLGSPTKHATLVNNLQSNAKFPLLIGMDAEWGVSMRLDSIIAYPWNMTLGAIQNDTIVYQVGKRIGEQSKRLGIHINFAPVVDINNNPDNPIIGNRSFGETKENVTRKGISFMNGLHDSGVLSSAKHFPGHGNTNKDSHLTLPKINSSIKELDSTELYPFKKLINKGVSSVMIGHLNVPALDKNIPSSLSDSIITGLLKKKMGFKGLVFTDALNMKGVTKNFENVDLAAFLAGNDILLISEDVEKGIRTIKNAYFKGVITEQRLSHSVKKILKAKYKVGLDNYKPICLDNLYNDLNSPKDTLLYKKAITSSISVLKNKSNVLPIKNNEKIGLITLGDGESSPFENKLHSRLKIDILDFKDTLNIEKQIAEYDKIIISFHKSNSSPWSSYNFNQQEINIIKKVATYKKTILNLFVKPYALKKIDSILTNISGIIISYQNSSIAQQVSADSMIGISAITGKTPVSPSPSYNMGAGLVIKSIDSLVPHSADVLGFDSSKLSLIDSLAQKVIDSMIAPGMQVVVARKGKIAYQKSFGYHTYNKNTKVKNTDIYDLASLTKILAMLPLVLQEVDKNPAFLNTTISSLLPNWKNTNKGDIKLKPLLSHYAKFIPWIPFHKETFKRYKRYYRKKPSRRFSTKIADNLYVHPKRVTKKITKSIQKSKLRDTLEYKYSDLPFYILKEYFEKKYKKGIDQLLNESFYSPLGLKKTLFNPLEKISKSEIIPTEVDTKYRNQELQGYVHDMGAALVGGVGGHAGLFSNAYEVALLMQVFLQKGAYKNTTFFAENTFDTFNNCHYCDQGNRRGIILDKPAPEKIDSYTHDFSKSFGHYGFTGTYAWADPEKDLVFVFLSNRIYPSAENKLLMQHNIRERMHRIVYDAIIEK